MERYDIVIIGTGPAGLSAATAKETTAAAGSIDAPEIVANTPANTAINTDTGIMCINIISFIFLLFCADFSAVNLQARYL